MSEFPLWAIYALPLACILCVYLLARRRREIRSRDTMRRAEAAGLTDPPSLHPVVDHTLCMGSGACARACPEGTIGVVNGKAHLINPTVCIGHGACAAACPVEAIKLVFGTERRGVDIPLVKPSFETNVAGVYIAGELGGMGLIRKAAEQGRQAMESISKTPGTHDQLDVLIVGAGPAGLAATLAAMEKKLRFVTIEQEDSLGGTVYHYPRNKIVMSQPVTLPLVGKVKLGEISKESLLEFWQDIVDRVGMPIRYGERLEKIVSIDDGFAVRTAGADYRTRNVLLAIGRRGTPRKLAVPGEDLPKVVYRLVDPEQYRGKRVLVVGGGDSAIEAAVAIAGETGAHATLSYRGNAFGRVKPQNRERLAGAEKSGKLKVMLESSAVSIDQGHAVLEHNGGTVTIDNDAVIVCAGGILPTPMLKDIGVIVETKYGTA